MLPNTSRAKRVDTEERFRDLLEKYFRSRGAQHRQRREVLANEMKQLRERLCVSWEQFKYWFRKVWNCFFKEEEEAVHQHFFAAQQQQEELAWNHVSPDYRLH